MTAIQRTLHLHRSAELDDAYFGGGAACDDDAPALACLRLKNEHDRFIR